MINFENEYIRCNVEIFNNSENISIKGYLNDINNYKKVILLAANSVEKRASYSGSGLPFPCPEIAFENTPNVYEVPRSGIIDIVFTYPNSYYTVANKEKVISSIFLILETFDNNKQFIRLELEDLYVLRTLVDRETRNGPQFYSDKYDILPIDTAENTMINYAYLKYTKGLA